MMGMRRLARPGFFFALVLLLMTLAVSLPANIEAAASPICSGGLAGDPKGSKTIPVSKDAAAQVKTYLRQVLCANACFDENIAFQVSVQDQKLTVTVTTTNKCTKSQEDPQGLDAGKNKRGCTKGLTPPVAIMKTPSVNHIYRVSLIGTEIPINVVSRTIGPKSRCDPALLESAGLVVDTLSGNDIADSKKVDVALDALQNSTPNVQTTALDATTNQAILDAFGPDVAQQVEKSGNTAEVEAAIKSGDKAAVEDALKRSGVTLNDDVLKKVATLTSDEREGLASEEDREKGILASDDTFERTPQVTDMDRASCAIAGIESSSCINGRPNNYHVVGPRVCNSRGCGSAYGKYQVMWFNIPSWTAQSCGRTIYDPDEFRADTGCQEQVFQTMFSQHVAACNGSFEGAASMWHSGRCFPSNSTDGYMRTSTYVQKFSAYFNGATPSAIAASYTTRSPFASVNPFLSTSPVGYVPNTGGYITSGGYYSGGSSMSPMSFLQQIFTQIQSSDSQQSVSQPSYQPVSSQLLSQQGQIIGQSLPPDPVALIIVQPREISRGGTLLVSWSTVGMSTSDLCGVYVRADGAEALLARNNEGSRTAKTNATSTPGVWDFTLRCTTVSGTSLEQKTSAVVR